MQPQLLSYMLHLDLALSRAAAAPDGPASPGQSEDRALVPEQHAALQSAHQALQQALGSWLAQAHPRRQVPACPPRLATLQGVRVLKVDWTASKSGNAGLSFALSDGVQKEPMLLLMSQARLESSYW